MTPFLAVLGIVGAFLILVGLVGGGFTISTAEMPEVKNWVRVPCFGVGVVLVGAAFVFGFGYNPHPGNTLNPHLSSSTAAVSTAAVDSVAPTSPPTRPPLASATPSPNPWNVVSAYFSDISTGDYTDAWNLLSPSMQSQAWEGSYSRFVSDFTPLGYHNVSKMSESGDSVTVTYTLHNINTGSWMPKSETLTVDNGLITSSTG